MWQKTDRRQTEWLTRPVLERHAPLKIFTGSDQDTCDLWLIALRKNFKTYCQTNKQKLFECKNICFWSKEYDNSLKNRKMHFCQIFGVSKLLTGQENGSQKGITGHEFGSQNCLPDINLALKTTYRLRIWPSNILTRHNFFSNVFVQTTIPDLKFWIFLYQMSVLIPGLIIMSHSQPLVCLRLHRLYR